MYAEVKSHVAAVASSRTPDSLARSLARTLSLPPSLLFFFFFLFLVLVLSLQLSLAR